MSAPVLLWPDVRWGRLHQRAGPGLLRGRVGRPPPYRRGPSCRHHRRPYCLPQGWMLRPHEGDYG